MQTERITVSIRFLTDKRCQEIDELVSKLKSQDLVEDVTEVPSEIGGLIPFESFELILDHAVEGIVLGVAGNFVYDLLKKAKITTLVNKLSFKDSFSITLKMEDANMKVPHIVCFKFKKMSNAEVLCAVSKMSDAKLSEKIINESLKLVPNENVVHAELNYNKKRQEWEVSNVWRPLDYD